MSALHSITKVWNVILSKKVIMNDQSPPKTFVGNPRYCGGWRYAAKHTDRSCSVFTLTSAAALIIGELGVRQGGGTAADLAEQELHWEGGPGHHHQQEQEEQHGEVWGEEIWQQWDYFPGEKEDYLLLDDRTKYHIFRGEPAPVSYYVWVASMVN